MKLASASLILLASAMATRGQLVAPDANGLHLALPKKFGDAYGPSFTHEKSAPSYVPGKILASYTSAESLKLINEHVNSKASFLGEGNVELNSVNKFSRPQQANGGDPNADGGSGGPSSIESNVPVLGYVVIKTDESNVRHEMGELASIPGVKHVERDPVMHILDSKTTAGASDGDDDRQGRRLQVETKPWGIDMVNVTHLWEIEPKSHIKICVVDGGYDLGHVDLPTENVTGWAPGDGIWYTGGGGNGHGTHVAGTIGAIGGNGEGVVGVNPDPTRFSFHISKACGDYYCYDVLEAVQSCKDAGARVISMSLSGDPPGYSATAEMLYQDVYNQDILVIAAAGNDGRDAINYPSSYKTVVSVASVAEGGGEGSYTYGELSSFSTRNDQTEIAAPGSNVLSTLPGNRYGLKSGTSMACPHVSGIAALLWSHFPECKNNQIRNAMINVDSVREPPITDPQNTIGWNKYYGWGIVNAGLAYELLRTMGCEGAGGTYSEPLSSMASGGSQQKSLGCVNDEQCPDANPCLGQSQMKCNLDDNTCSAEQAAVPDCDDGVSCTNNVCTPLREIVDGKNYMCTNPNNCGNGFTCDIAGDQQCGCTDNIVQVYIYTEDSPEDVSYILQNQCTQPTRIEFENSDPNRDPYTWYQDQYCFPDTQILVAVKGSKDPYWISVYNNVPEKYSGLHSAFDQQITLLGTCPPPTDAPTDVPTDAPTNVPTSSPMIPSPTASPIASKSGKGSKATGTSSKSGKESGAYADGEAVHLEDEDGSMSMLLGDTGSMPMHVKKEGEFGRRE